GASRRPSCGRQGRAPLSGGEKPQGGGRDGAQFWGAGKRRPGGANAHGRSLRYETFTHVTRRNQPNRIWCDLGSLNRDCSNRMVQLHQHAGLSSCDAVRPALFVLDLNTTAQTKSPPHGGLLIPEANLFWSRWLGALLWGSSGRAD